MTKPESTPLTNADVALIATSTTFVSLRRRRAAFLILATIIAIMSFLCLPISILIAPETMSSPVLGPMTPAFFLSMALFVMTWFLLAAKMRVARIFDVDAAAIVRDIRKHQR